MKLLLTLYLNIKNVIDNLSLRIKRTLQELIAHIALGIGFLVAIIIKYFVVYIITYGIVMCIIHFVPALTNIVPKVIVILSVFYLLGYIYADYADIDVTAGDADDDEEEFIK